MSDDKSEFDEFAGILAEAITKGITETEHTFTIPFTTITVGWNRMAIETMAGKTKVLEIRICW